MKKKISRGASPQWIPDGQVLMNFNPHHWVCSVPNRSWEGVERLRQVVCAIRASEWSNGDAHECGSRERASEQKNDDSGDKLRRDESGSSGSDSLGSISTEATLSGAIEKDKKHSVKAEAQSGGLPSIVTVTQPLALAPAPIPAAVVCAPMAMCAFMQPVTVMTMMPVSMNLDPRVDPRAYTCAGAGHCPSI
jgi:hypothetical protein